MEGDFNFRSAFWGALVAGAAALLFAFIRLVFARGFLNRIDSQEKDLQLLAKRDEDTERRLQLGNLRFDHMVQELQATRAELKELRTDVTDELKELRTDVADLRKGAQRA